jgi:hypothetical protein
MRKWAVVLFVLTLIAGGAGLVIGVKIAAMVIKALFWIFLISFIALTFKIRQSGNKRPL